MAKKKNRISAGEIVAISAGAAAAAAGAYYFLGPKGKKHQQKAKAAMGKMKIEVEKQLKKAKKVTGPLYQNAIDAAAAAYGKKYKEHAGEINAFAKKLKGEWRSVQKKAAPALKKAKRAVKKARARVS